MNIDENYTTKCSIIDSVVKRRSFYMYGLLLLEY